MEAIPSLALIRVIKLDELIALWSHGRGYFGKQQSIRIRIDPFLASNFLWIPSLKSFTLSLDHLQACFSSCISGVYPWDKNQGKRCLSVPLFPPD